MVSDFNQKIKTLRQQRAKVAAIQFKKKHDKETIKNVLATLG